MSPHSSTMIAPTFAAAVVIALIAISSCAEFKDRSRLLDGVPTHKVALKCPHTGIPDLELTVPKEFEASDITSPNDKFDKHLVSRFSDPEPVPGQIVLTVTRTPSPAIPDTGDAYHTRGAIAGVNVTWLENVLDDANGTIHQREVIDDDVLTAQSASTGETLYLHVFVVGTDQKLVEQLTASVETLKVLPARPNL